jgi:recombination associated protein RdgC
VGVFKGSISLTRFIVRGKPPKRFAATFLERIALRAFTDLDPDLPDEEKSGWCVAETPLDLGLLHEQIFMGPYLVLGLRTDRWRVPRALLKAQLAEAVDAWRERTGRDKINRREKDELKLRILRKLRKRVVPTMRHVDMCWNLDQGSVLLWTRAERTKEDFRALFEQTFSLELDEATALMAAAALYGVEAVDEVSDLEVTLLGESPVEEDDS